ncbi:MAG: transcription elongation factor GreA [Ignavibacteria bacterium]|nr:transcription elongation factor GreA [Ignavibacteria bacterium]
MEQNGNVYITRERLVELENELRELKTFKRKQVADKIAEARAHGDISENAEYDAAREEQAHLEIKIAKLENILSRVIVIDEKSMPDDEVHILCTVSIRDLQTGRETDYTLVSPEESDFEQNKISIVSPIGKALLGKKINDIIEVNNQNGIRQYKILKITK